MGFVSQGAEIVDLNVQQQNADTFRAQESDRHALYQQYREAEEAASRSRQEAEYAAAQSAEFARQAAERSYAEAQAAAERSRYDAYQTMERDRSRYNEELFRMTAEAANQPLHEPHSYFPGATTGQIHSDPNTVLMPRDYASDQNASYLADNPGHIPQYGVNSPVVDYVTNIPTDDMMRAHGPTPTGNWATMGGDLNYGSIAGSEAQGILDLSYAPSHVSDVNLPLGTPVERSRPISERASQFFFQGVASWFSNTRKLG